MMYDFQYRAPASAPLGAFVPLTIEGAPDHGTIADARVWAEHYGLRISLLGSRGRWLCDVFPDGKVIGVTQRLHDLLDRVDDRSPKRVRFDSIKVTVEGWRQRWSVKRLRAAILGGLEGATADDPIGGVP